MQGISKFLRRRRALVFVARTRKAIVKCYQELKKLLSTSPRPFILNKVDDDYHGPWPRNNNKKKTTLSKEKLAKILRQILPVENALSILESKEIKLENILLDYNGAFQNGCRLNFDESKHMSDAIFKLKTNTLKLIEQVEQLETIVNNIIDRELAPYESNFNDVAKTIHELQTNATTKIPKMLYGHFKIFEERMNSTKSEVEEFAQELHKTNEEKIKTFSQKVKRLPQDCRDIQKRGYNIYGVYKIKPTSNTPSFLVLCDMVTQGGGWISVLERFDGSLNFIGNFSYYKHGFGDYNEEHWLGLKYLYYLTDSKSFELLIELRDWDLSKVYALYQSFEIGNEQEGYKIKSLGVYSGSAGDSLSPHLGMKFSTVDLSRDTSPKNNCAQSLGGAGWWYKDCHTASLTGAYLTKDRKKARGKGIHWDTFKGLDYSLKAVRIFIRPRETWLSPGVSD